MFGDSDIVRCSSPWPGTAAQLLEAFATLGQGDWTMEQLCAAVPVGIIPGDAMQILSSLALADV